MGLQDLLAVAEMQGHAPRNLVVWGVQPECIEMGTELTATLAAAVEPVVIRVLKELQGWGSQYEKTGEK
jgi:hydrogenase maturation protease